MYLNNVTSTGFADRDAQAQTIREATIVRHLTHVHALAKRLRSQVPSCVTLDDLIGAGTIGLIQAVDRFQPSRGLQFATYAKHRIRGAMLDFLREEDPLSRAERRRTRTANATAAGAALPTTISLEQLPAHEPRSEYTPARGFSTRFTDRVDLDRARQFLSEREKRAIELIYDFGWQSREVAAELRVNESRVSQCGFRAKWGTDSNGSGAVIPIEVGRDSGGKWGTL
jgi:RNA polymerase sigma factor for flagellar operon FliA